MSRKDPTNVATTLVVPEAAQFEAYGKLSWLASFCPLHQRFSPALLRSFFLPAVTHDCVRFFANEQGTTAAALIWARLSDEVSQRMVFDNRPPAINDWNSGENLWFLDLIAPFGHGRQIARHLARNPPEDPFYFARLGRDGKITKVVHGDISKGRYGMVRAYPIDRIVA